MGTRGESPSHSSQQDAEVGCTKIKKESTDNEIKEFAETAMNEMLGWYGYGESTNETSRRTSSRTSSTPRSLRKHSSDVHTTDSDSTDDEELKLRRNRIEAMNSSEGEITATKSENLCGWCNKPLLPSSCGSFCSELCFSQSRRASFKKNKTCDWCRHIRHTVSYVDFQDGASQLQFCSDKCLNQYKMHIFCREAQAHLELLPAPPQNNQGALITPELWLRNCESPTVSPPPQPEAAVPPKPQTSPLPLITVAHPNKLMPKKKIRTKQPQDIRKPLPPPPPNLFFRPPPPFHPPPQFYLPPPPPPSLLPPTTILVPYPIILPIPLPIPIPVPLNDFLKAAATSKEREETEEEIIVEDEVRQNSPKLVRKRKLKKEDQSDAKEVKSKIKFVSV